MKCCYYPDRLKPAASPTSQVSAALRPVLWRHLQRDGPTNQAHMTDSNLFSAAEYLQFAEQCDIQAQQAKTPQQKREFVDRAALWRRLTKGRNMEGGNPSLA